MSEWLTLKASDGHELSAYVSRPKDEANGALVVLQEIFGVNASIRSVVDSYAEQGFVTIAPALFDRIEKGVELTYEGADPQRGRGLMGQLNPANALLDIAAAYEYAQSTGKGVGVLGFCYGGLMSWLSATRGEDVKMQPSCCVGYYAGGIGKVAAEEPACPVMLHFGADDSHIGQDQVQAVRDTHPEVEIHLYEDAGHAFANAARASFVPAAADLARERTLAFLKAHVA